MLLAYATRGEDRVRSDLVCLRPSLAACLAATAAMVPMVGVLVAPAFAIMAGITLGAGMPRRRLRGRILAVLLAIAVAVPVVSGGHLGILTVGDNLPLYAMCKLSVDAIGKGIWLYASGHSGAPPPDLLALSTARLIRSPKTLACPISGSELGTVDYFYFPEAFRQADALLVCDLHPHGSGARSVLLGHGEVRGMSRRKFAAELAHPRNAAFRAAFLAAGGTLRADGTQRESGE